MREAFPLAGKDWNCNECNCLISRGETYQRITIGAKNVANCISCSEIWEEIQGRRGKSGFFPKHHELGTLRSLLRRSPNYHDLLDDFGN